MDDSSHIFEFRPISRTRRRGRDSDRGENKPAVATGPGAGIGTAIGVVTGTIAGRTAPDIRVLPPRRATAIRAAHHSGCLSTGKYPRGKERDDSTGANLSGPRDGRQQPPPFTLPQPGVAVGRYYWDHGLAGASFDDCDEVLGCCLVSRCDRAEGWLQSSEEPLGPVAQFAESRVAVFGRLPAGVRGDEVRCTVLPGQRPDSAALRYARLAMHGEGPCGQPDGPGRVRPPRAPLRCRGIRAARPATAAASICAQAASRQCAGRCPQDRDIPRNCRNRNAHCNR